VDDHQVPQLVRQPGRLGRGALEQRLISAFVASKPFLEQEAPIEDGAADVGDAGRLDPVHRLPARDAVDVERRVPAPSGTTGTAVVRAASAGSSSWRIFSRITPMCSIALTPRNGMLPWPMCPCVVTSNQ
jgi:hypothetical protein